MTTKIIVPTLGESVTEATVIKWFKEPGDAVQVDESLCELETDKVTVEVPCSVSGVLKEIVAQEGMDVEVGGVLAHVDEGATASAPKAEAAPAPAPASAPAPAPAATEDAMSPAVLKLVTENNLDASAMTGTGKDGRLVKGDVIAYMDSQKAPAPAPIPAPAASVENLSLEASPPAAPAAAQYPTRMAGPREEKVPMSRLRRVIASRLKEAQNTAAMLTTFNEVDMTEVMAMRARYKETFEKKHGVKLGFMSIFIKACVTALREIPAINAEINGNDIIYKNHYDIGVAVGTKNGLVVPVVRDTDALSFAQIEQTISDYGRRAREGRLSIEDMSGGTFTITNGGVFGSLLSTPILNTPQSGILGMHKIQQRAMVMADGSIEARPMMYLALSYDHRIVDGREAVTFLVRVKDCLENPERIMIDA